MCLASKLAVQLLLRLVVGIEEFCILNFRADI